MYRTYRKTDVETHNEYYGKVRPAVNVKVYSFPSSFQIAEHFKCEEKEAERAGEFAFESACSQFWESVQDMADDVFGKGNVRVFSEGRSGAWLVVEGLPSIEEWSLMDLNRWRSFETAIKREVKYRTSETVVFEDIKANQWTKAHAEMFNFVERPDGSTACLADLKAEAIKAGFGPVVRI